MGHSLTRRDKAERHMFVLAILLYLIDKKKDDQKDYLLLMAIKYFRQIKDTVPKLQLRSLFRMTEGQMDKAIDRMRARGWVAEHDGYLSATSYGDMEFSTISGWISLIIHKIKNNLPIYEWNKSKKQ